MKRYFFSFLLPGAGMIALAFYAGTHPSVIFALAGFLSFFVVGVTLIREGYSRCVQKKNLPNAPS